MPASITDFGWETVSRRFKVLQKLDMDHPVFHCVFDLRGLVHRLRVPTMQYLSRHLVRRKPNPDLTPPYRWSNISPVTHSPINQENKVQLWQSQLAPKLLISI